MTETITIGGVDYTATDYEARDIMNYLATEYGITEQKWAYMPWREQTNLILLAQQEINASKADDIREFPAEDGKSVVSIDRRHVVATYPKGSGHVSNVLAGGPTSLLTDRIEVVLRPDREFDIKQIETILCAADEFSEWMKNARTA